MDRRLRPLLLWPTLLFVSLALAAAPGVAQQQPSASVATAGEFSPVSYQPGEKLTYNISFSNFSSAAHVELFNAGRGQFFNREGFELRAHVETVGEVRAALYAINNDYTAFVDPANGLPFHTRVQSLADADVAQATSGIGQSPAAIEATPSTYDYLAALYRLRAFPLAPGATYRLDVQGDTSSGSATSELELRVVGRESVKTAAGNFNTIVTQVRVRNDATLNNYRPRIYFTDDARHLPVQLTARLPSGELRAQLASSELIELTPTLPAGDVATQPTPTPTPRLPVNDAPPAGGEGDGNANSNANNDLPFKVGEQLNFSFFLGTATQPVGTANYQVRARNKYAGGREGFWLSATMATTNAAQQLFPVADKIETYVDVRTLLPFRSELQIREGNHRVQGVVSLDQERGTAIATDGKPIEIPVGTYDLVSVIYALRSFDLAPPKRNAVSILINKRPRTLFITSIKRETIEVGGRRIPAFQLALATDEPQQGDRFNLRLWVGTDKRRLPLRLTATTPLGPVRADLSIIPLTAQ